MEAKREAAGIGPGCGAGAPAFGLLTPMVANGRTAGQLLRELVVEAQAAEQAGFDLIWVPEHHEGPEGMLTDPITVSTWLLARTERIAVGTGVLIAPLHDAVRVAEQAAILHEASRGRFVLGLGAGYQAADFALFHRDRARRRQQLEATIETIRRAWSGQEVEDRRVVPRPSVSAPRIWLGAWSRGGIRAAAELADGWIADPIRSEPEVEEMARRYREAARAAGREPRVHVIRDLWVAESVGEVGRYGRYVEPVYRYYVRQGAVEVDGRRMAENGLPEGLLEERLLCGSPDQVTERLTSLLHRTGASGCSFAMRHPAGPPHEEVLQAIRLLGAEVLPRVRAALRS